MGYYDRYGDGGWAPYVPVAERQRKAQAQAKRMAKKGKPLSPVNITGRKIADTFWGTAWCDNLEKYCDFENRMPRGRTYARNGSVVDLQIDDGRITSLVSGSDLYKIEIKIDRLPAKEWATLCKTCSIKVTSLLDLMRGKLPAEVIARLTDPKQGMFPKPTELHARCSCPDYARMCKHIAAVLYGVGHRLDTQPELFFKLRGVEQMDLVSQALTTQKTEDVIGIHQSSSLDGEDLGSMFGIDLVSSTDSSADLRNATVIGSKSVSRRKFSSKGTVPTKTKSEPKDKRASKAVTKLKHQVETLKAKAKPKAKEPKRASNDKLSKTVRANAKPATAKSMIVKSVGTTSKLIVAQNSTAEKKVATKAISKSVSKIGTTPALKKAAKPKTKKSRPRTSAAPALKSARKAR